MPLGEGYDVVVLGSGIAGLAAALAAHEAGLRPVLIEKADTIGGTTTNSYGLIWIGSNHLMRAAGEADTRDEVIAYMTFLGGGELDDKRMTALVDRSPEVLRFFEDCGIKFRLVGGIVDHYFGVASGARGAGRTVEADLISGYELGEWRERIRTPKDAPYFVTAAEQTAWGGINRFSYWDQNLVRERREKDIRGKGVGLVSHFVKALAARGVPIVLNQAVENLSIEQGRVTGVTLADGRKIAARKGVVLATGGYEWNEDLMRDFDPLPGLEPLSPPSLTGDGLIMAAEQGAAIRRIQNNLNLMLGFRAGSGCAEHCADPVHGRDQRNVQPAHHRREQKGRAVRRRVLFPECRSGVAKVRHHDAFARQSAVLPDFRRAIRRELCARAPSGRDARFRIPWCVRTACPSLRRKWELIATAWRAALCASTPLPRPARTRIFIAASCAGASPAGPRPNGRTAALAPSTSRRTTASSCIPVSARRRPAC